MTSAAIQAGDAARPFRSWLGWALWLALTAVLVMAARRLPWRDMMARLADANPAWLLAAVLANLAILPLWAAEWRLLVPRAFAVGYRRMFGIVATTASVLNSVPFLAGEASAVALLITRAGLSRGAALSVLALDQLLVAFAKLATLAVTALVVTLPAWLDAGIATLVGAFVALLGTLLVLAHSWERLEARLANDGSPAGVLARVIRWGRQMDALRDARLAAPAAALALVKKGAELAGIVAVQLAFGMDASLPAGLLVLAALGVTTMLPVAPANLGVYEGTVFLGYRYMGVPADAALGMAVVQHACFLLPSLLTGYVAVTAGQLARRPRAG